MAPAAWRGRKEGPQQPLEALVPWACAEPPATFMSLPHRAQIRMCLKLCSRSHYCFKRAEEGAE
eukprot:scaffold28216_cov31-Tisochrysis_lutea.AAC.6